jgi:serine/threonine protein kinase
MNDLSQAVAFLESVNLAHGDLRPENVLLDRNQLKLSDFDCTVEIGTNYEACVAPYGRILNNESDQGECGTPGFLDPRTEQFALGSLYYLMNYGFEVYGDRCLTEDPYEHGPKVVDLLQNMEFPTLDGNPLIDNIIDKCWHNRYVTVSELAAHTKTLLNDRTDVNESNENRKKESSGVTTFAELIFNERWRMAMGRMDQNCMEEDFLKQKEFCQDLEKRGLLHALSSGEPEQIGFTFDWYRHSLYE